MTKYILPLLLCLPIIGFGQADLTGLIFQLIDSKDARALLEDKGWETKSISNYTDEDNVSYNEFKLSKHIHFSEEDHSRAYFTIREYNGYSNEIALTVYNKDFFKHFQNIIINSSYKQISKDVEKNVIETTYRRSPLEAVFKEKLTGYYQIRVSNYHHKKRRSPTKKYINKKKQHTDNTGKIWMLDNNKKDEFYKFLDNHHQLFINNQLDKVSKNYTPKLERFHSLYNIDKEIAMKDHKNYLKSYKVIKSNIDKKTLNIFKRNTDSESGNSSFNYYAEYILYYEIIRLKDNKHMKFVIESSKFINSNNKIYSSHTNILTRE